MLTEELNRRGLAYVWGLMGLPGSLARIMVDSGNLVGDVVSEEFAQQVNLAGESCWKEIETAAAASKMQIIGRCYPVKGMKNAVNLGQQFLSRYEAQLTFTEGRVSLRIRGGEVYLEEKGYSGIDRQASKAPAAAGSWDRVPPEEREDTWTALLPPRERERLLSRQPRVDSRRGPSHIWWPLSDSGCVICPLEEVSDH